MRAANPNTELRGPVAAFRPIRATAADVESIFDLKRSVLKQYLWCTIYRSPKAVRYLAEMASSGQRSRNELFVVHDGGRMIGYYHALVRDREYFLNYLAVCQKRQSTGLGAALMQHFHNRAKRHRCERTGLEVFASNRRVHHWYVAQGYLEVGQRWLCEVDLGRLQEPKQATLLWESSEYENALASENQYGFGKFMCQMNGSDMILGLIASDSCKILSFPQLIDEKVLQAIASAMVKTRKTLVLALPEKPPRSCPVLRSELSLTLARQLT